MRNSNPDERLIKTDVGASSVTSYGGGGKISVMYAPDTALRLASVYRTLREESDPFILGGGSNTIIRDGVIARPVISTQNLCGLEFDGETAIAGAGTRIGRIIAEGRKNSLGGLDFLAGVPATAGGALKMNAGAFGGEIGDLFVKADILSPFSGEITELTADAADFGYRKGIDGIVLRVWLRLKRMPPDKSQALARECLEYRKRTQPSQPSCGSVFRSANQPAARYIDALGLKGTCRGGAKISDLHANFIVNDGGGTAEDFLYLASLAQTSVEKRFGVKLEREFVLLE